MKYGAPAYHSLQVTDDNRHMHNEIFVIQWLEIAEKTTLCQSRMLARGQSLALCVCMYVSISFKHGVHIQNQTSSLQSIRWPLRYHRRHRSFFVV